MDTEMEHEMETEMEHEMDMKWKSEWCYNVGFRVSGLGPRVWGLGSCMAVPGGCVGSRNIYIVTVPKKKM